MSEKHINSLLVELSGTLQESESKSRLQESYQVLKKVVETIAYDEEYSKEENPHTFKELIENLEDAFKYAFDSFMIEYRISASGDAPISSLNGIFYTQLARRRRLPANDYVLQAYPPITLLIRMLRNCQKHETHRPIDHITKKKSFGNLYTISSVIILAIYAYLEILQAWSDTIKIDSAPQQAGSRSTH
jgi:hypothetical protein